MIQDNDLSSQCKKYLFDPDLSQLDCSCRCLLQNNRMFALTFRIWTLIFRFCRITHYFPNEYPTGQHFSAVELFSYRFQWHHPLKRVQLLQLSHFERGFFHLCFYIQYFHYNLRDNPYQNYECICQLEQRRGRWQVDPFLRLFSQ